MHSPSLDSNTGFLSRSKPEGAANSDEADAKERRTVVQVIDDSTDTALPVEHEVSSNVATRRVEDLALRSTNLKHRVFNNDAVVNVRTPSLEPTGLNPISLGLKVADKAELTPTTTIKVKELAVGSAVFTAVVKKTADISYIDERKQKRARAINLWWDLLATVIDASEIGRKASAEAPADHLDCSYAKEILDACFGLKSPGTFLKRYYSLKSFHDWCVQFKTDAWLPMTEGLAWEYTSDGSKQWQPLLPRRHRSWKHADFAALSSVSKARIWLSPASECVVLRIR